MVVIGLVGGTGAVVGSSVVQPQGHFQGWAGISAVNHAQHASWMKMALFGPAAVVRFKTCARLRRPRKPLGRLNL